MAISKHRFIQEIPVYRFIPVAAFIAMSVQPASNIAKNLLAGGVFQLDTNLALVSIWTILTILSMVARPIEE